ncbi:MAG: glycosyltransferase family 4 protein [Anaerolineales bacterium]|nr:glycosyltransferase family 4 protein [Anaerolineales bacterium]
MHICFVAPFGLGQKTTVWARTLPLAQALVAHGVQVSIVLPPWDTPADAGRRWQESGVTLINVATAGGVAPTTARMLHEIDRLHPSLVHIVKPRAHAGLVQWWLWQRRKCRHQRPLLLDVDDWEQAWAPINRYPRLTAYFLAWQEEWGLRHADGVTAASQWLRSRTEAYNPGVPVLYLPNGVDAEPGQLIWQPPGLGDVLFFTRFVEVEPAWLAAFARTLYAKRPQTHLLIGGSPVQSGLDAPFRRALATLEQIHWLGYLPASVMPALYARISCAIFPAADVPLQQAKCSVRMATMSLSGVPIVASAVGEQRTYGEATGTVLVPAGASPALFADHVIAVLENETRPPAPRRRTPAPLLNRYGWSQLGARLFDFYTKFNPS